MGYNNTFFAFNENRVHHFPLDHTAVFDADFRHDLPWPQFKTWLLDRGGKIRSHEDDSVEMEYLDRGSITFRGGRECIGLDIHAPWNEVLDAFLALKELTQNVVIFDPQTGMFHDETSFRARFDSTHL